MEKGIARLVEAATVAEQRIAESDYVFFHEVRVEGIVTRLSFNRDGKAYSLTKVTSWRELHPRPDTKNPLIGAMDALIQEMTEFQA